MALEPGENRIDEDRQQHRFDAAPAVAEDAESDAAGRPADEEYRGRRSRPIGDLFWIRIRAQQFVDRRDGRG